MLGRGTTCGVDGSALFVVVVMGMRGRGGEGLNNLGTGEGEVSQVVGPSFRPSWAVSAARVCRGR
jgi:hypothetical protein